LKFEKSRIRGQEIIDGLTTQLLQSRHQQSVQEFMQEKYNWTNITFHNINWDLHNDVHQHCTQHKQFNTKLIHHWLPVASHPSQAKDNKYCFRCNTVEEDQHHWYKCPCEDATKIRTYLRTESVTFLHTTKLHHTIQNLLIDQLYNTPSIPPNNILQVYNKQKLIGWEHFLRGRISQDWIDLQNKLSNRQDGEHEWRKAIIHIFHSLHEMWLDRNQELHGTEQSSLDRRKENIIKPTLTRIYNLQHLVPIQDRQLFDKTIEEMLELPTRYLETWITRHEKYLQKAAERETARIKLHNTAITHFFTKLSPSKKSRTR
jgi:hypothetical protein